MLLDRYDHKLHLVIASGFLFPTIRTSDAFAFANNALFYVEDNVLKAIDLTTKQPITNFYPRTVMTGSSLEADDKGFVFYVANDGSLNYLLKNGNFSQY